MDKLYNGKKITFGEGIDAGKLLKLIFEKAIFVFLGVLCGSAELPFGALPFGFALLAASDKNCIFVYLGLVASSFRGAAEQPQYTFLLIGAYTSELLLRALVSLTYGAASLKGKSRLSMREVLSALFSEKAGFRVLTALVAAFFFSLFLTVGEGFLYYDLFGLAINSLAAPTAAYLFYAFFCKQGVWRDAGIIALLAASALGAVPLSIYGVSLAVLGGFVAVFALTQRKGLAMGVFSALAVGLVQSPSLSPAFIFAALFAWIFGRISLSLVCSVTFICAVGWGFYISGLDALNGFLGGVLGACLIYPALCKFFSFQSAVEKKKSKASEKKGVPCVPLGVDDLDGIRLAALNKRMSHISESLQGISEMLKITEKKMLVDDELRKVCKDAFEASCAGCGEFEFCKDSRLQKKTLENAMPILKEGRRLDYSCTPSDLFVRCSRLPDILDEINYNSSALFSSERTRGEWHTFEGEDISRLLSECMEKDSCEYEPDEELSKEVCRVLEGLALGIQGAVVFGKRRRYVFLRGEKAACESKDLIFSSLCAVLPFSLEEASLITRRQNGFESMIYAESKAFSAVIATRQRRAKGEKEYCGDSASSFENEDNRFIAVISDGMGSGKNASEVSGICKCFVENMLSKGEMSQSLVEILGGILRRRSEESQNECSATLDLFSFDLVNGQAELFKSGASPSYVFKNGSVVKLRAHNMPIGILPNSECKRFSFPLSKGDAVVMMSDGVFDGKEDCGWLYELINKNAQECSPNYLADAILSAASAISSDDITVSVIKIN